MATAPDTVNTAKKFFKGLFNRKKKEKKDDKPAATPTTEPSPTVAEPAKPIESTPPAPVPETTPTAPVPATAAEPIAPVKTTAEEVKPAEAKPADVPTAPDAIAPKEATKPAESEYKYKPYTTPEVDYDSGSRWRMRAGDD
jgi:hypothetical protein